MRLYVWSGNLKEGKEKEYKEWVLKEYIDQMKKHAAPGWTFKGIYHSSALFGGPDVSEMWEFEKFADFDKIVESTDPVVNSLLDKSYGFFQPGSCRGQVLQDIKDDA